MEQEMLVSISLLLIEADLLGKINFDDIIKNLARHKSGQKNFEMQMYVFSYL